MQAIITKYLPGTEGRGARISAVWGCDRTSISYPHELTGIECHRAAAEALREKVKARYTHAEWVNRPLHGGHIKPGSYVFVVGGE